MKEHRTRVTLPQAWIIFLILVQLGVWVWGLSAIAADVENNRESYGKVSKQVSDNVARLERHESSIEVMKSQREDTSRRLERIEAKLDRLIEKQD